MAASSRFRGLFNMLRGGGGRAPFLAGEAARARRGEASYSDGPFENLERFKKFNLFSSSRTADA